MFVSGYQISQQGLLLVTVLQLLVPHDVLRQFVVDLRLTGRLPFLYLREQ